MSQGGRAHKQSNEGFLFRRSDSQNDRCLTKVTDTKMNDIWKMTDNRQIKKLVILVLNDLNDNRGKNFDCHFSEGGFGNFANVYPV